MYQKLISQKESSADEKPKTPQLSYLTGASWFDKLTHGWIFQLIKFANKQDIRQENLQDLAMVDKSQSVFSKWQSNWINESRTNTVDPLKKSLQDTFFRQYVFATILDFLAYQFTILTPLFIFFICKLLETDPRPPNMTGLCVFFLLVTPLCRFLRTVFDTHGLYRLGVLGTDISNCLALGMVNKSMKYSILCNKKFKMGEISNLMQVDCFRLSLYPKSFNGVFFIAYVLIFSIVLMAVLVHYSFLAGFAVMFLISGVNMIISRSTAVYQKQIANATDNRMKITNQIFNNIKFIKVNAWQEYFYDKLIARRDQEMKWYHKKFMTEAYSTYCMWLTPKLVLAATFGTYALLTDNLNPPTTFCIMNLYGYIQFYLQFLPQYISIVIECNNAIKRIQSFLLAEQINTSCITYNQYDIDKTNSIEVQNGNFYWDKETQVEGVVLKEPPLTLVDMNFNIKRGEIVAIIGDIGSGKSSLMYSLLGEMKFKQNLPKPKVSVNGTISLVTQKPWIINDTVRNNILFGKPYNKKKYEQIIHYACLKRDFELFTHGDKTMIGQKGATLSGGQKARISFARSLYSESDILLLDDLLSAVDVHVGKFLMTQTLLQYQRTKTRVLITHALYYLKYVDKVLIMENGKIVEQGSYEVIRASSRFKDIYSAMMKDQKKSRSDSINLLEIEAAEKDDQQKVDQQAKIQAQVIKEASIHTKKSRTQTAIDREKLQKLRAKKSQHPKKQVAKQQEKKQQKQQVSSALNELMMAEQSQGDVGFGLYKSFAKYNGGYFFMFLIFMVQVLWTLFNAGSNLWLSRWSERHQKITLLNQPDQPSNPFYLGIYIVLGLLYGTFAFIRALMVAYSSPKMSIYIHQKMVSNLLFSSLNQFFDRVPLGRIFNRLSKDLNSVDSNLPNNFSTSIVFTFFLATNLIVIMTIAPLKIFVPVLIVYLVLCHFLRYYIVKPQRQLTRLEGISKSPIVSCFTEILSGVTTIRSYNVKDMFFYKNCEKINQNKKPTIAKKATQVWFIFRLTLLAFIVNFTSLSYILFQQTKRTDIVRASAEAGLLLISTMGFDQIMYFLYANLNTFENQLISIERCQTFMSLEPEAGYAQYVKNREELKIKSRERRLMKKDDWPDRGRIDFIDFKCRYRKNLDLVLRGLTVTFQGGHKIGVVGRTGSGKSTIMMCLLRILEASQGKIILDGRDISQLSLDDLRSKITIILQDPCLFSGTIRENLDPLSQYTDQELTRALKQCALDETMNSRKGLETQITENGQNLSAGERQLVSIARAVLKPTKIVLVDEATANIDVRTESVIYRAMNEAFKNSTVITVAHRLNTVINSDRILVLEGGTLKEYDNPQELLKNPNSFFAQLYNQSQKQSKM